MSYENWKHILGVFSFQNLVYNGILVIKHTWEPTSHNLASPFDQTIIFSLGFGLKRSSFIFIFFFTGFRFLGLWNREAAVAAMGPIILIQLATGLGVLARADLVKSVMDQKTMAGPF